MNPPPTFLGKFQILKPFPFTKGVSNYATSIEVLEVFQTKEKIVTECIYSHPFVECSEFNNHYLTNLLQSLSKENKKVILLEDFNADLTSTGNILDFCDVMY